MRSPVLLLCSALLLAPAAEEPPTPPPGGPSPLTEAQIAAAEAWADAIMREEMPMMAISDEDRAAYTAIIAEVRGMLAEGMAALEANDRLAAGRHYVAARNRFIKIPRESGPALGEEYHKMAKAILAFTRILVEMDQAGEEPPRVRLPGVEPVVPPPRVDDLPPDEPPTPADDAPPPVGDALPDNTTTPSIKDPPRKGEGPQDAD